MPKLTAARDLFVVAVNGADVSQHRTEREAIESALNRVRVGNDVRYRHEYVVVVQAGTGVAVALTGEVMTGNPDG